MIPGTDVTMEDLLISHSEEVGRQYFTEITESSLVRKKLDAIGISSNTRLSHIHAKYDILPELRQEFEMRYEVAIDKEGLLNNHILDIQKGYEVVLPGNDYISLLLNADGVTKWHWPADYVAYHCKIEGYNPPLHNLSICIASELGFDEKLVVEKIDAVLRDLAKGYSTALFHEYLSKRQADLLGLTYHYEPYTSSNKSPIGKLNWLGSPVQFVQVIKLLVEHGFLDRDVYQGGKVTFLMQHFNINSQRGQAAFNTLRGYFSDPKIKFAETDAHLPDAEKPKKSSAKK